MGRRGRPPHPDILTPREWEVLALLREGLTNEAIADRLGVTHAAAKYHVSEILSKLGVATREEAAAWQPEAAREADAPSGPRLRRWAGVAGWLRPVTVGKAALIGAAVAVLAGMGVLAWGVLRESGEGGSAAVAGPTATEEPTPLFSPTTTQNPIITRTPISTPEPEPFLWGSFPWRNALYAIDPDTGDTSILLDHPPSFYDWSPDGSRIAYIQGYDNAELNFASLSGDYIRSVRLDPLSSVQGISWSPDSRYIAISGYVLQASGYPPMGGQLVQTSVIAFLEVSSGRTSVAHRNPERIYDNDHAGGYELESSLDWTADGRIVAQLSGWGREQGVGDTIIFMEPHGQTENLVKARHIALSPDGSALAYSRVPGVYTPYSDPQQTETVIASADGRTTYASLRGVSSLQWSPDGSRFTYTSYGDSGVAIRIASRDGSGDTVLAEGHDPVWSPDGERIAFVRAGIPYVINADGSGEEQLAESTLPSFGNMEWSPDGRVILAFQFSSATFVVQAKGGIPTRLLPGYSPRWSPSGNWIAFTWAAPYTTGIGGGGELFVMSPDATNTRQIGIRLGYSDVITGCSAAELQWSMDSSSVGIDTGFDGTVITSIEPGSIPRKLGRGCSALSPDLTKEAIATRSTDGGPCSVIVRSVDEAADNSGTGDCYVPKWSPDGRMIAYRSDNQILAVRATGGPATTVGSFNAAVNPSGDFEWSPDGSRIAYLDQSTIRVVTVSNPTQLISLPRPTGYSDDDFVAGGDGYGPDASISEPAWSPDGTAIAFSFWRGADLGGGYGTSEIYVTAADGSGVPRRLARGYDAHWSPDGSLITYTRDSYY